MFRDLEHRGDLLGLIVFTSLLLVMPVSLTHAQPLPGPADIDQTKPAEQKNLILQPPPQSAPVAPGEETPDLEIPPEAAAVTFTPTAFNVEGVTAFSAAEIETIYSPHIGNKTSIAIIWEVANAITKKYRDAGYFLSRAYVPAQEVSSGVPVIKVVEGYIGETSISGLDKNYEIIETAMSRIREQRPISTQALERELLLLNDLPGLSFQSILEPANNADAAAVRLALIARQKPGTTILSADNAGSRYLGPYQLSASWQESFLPLQATSLTFVTAPMRGEMKAFNAEHRFTLSTAADLYMRAGYTNALPGYRLKPQEIESDSVTGEMGINYHLIRQRTHNLTLQGGISLRNSKSDIAGSLLSRDKVRTAHIGLSCDIEDSWAGYNSANLVLTQGLSLLNSSKAGDINATRQGASPDFTKLQLSYMRMQPISGSWAGVLSLSGQKASRSLYSSEEFGYGGMSAGRAYDNSEIVGDDGLSASIEMRYQGITPVERFHILPYGFYDAGKVWNKNAGQEKKLSGSSAGFGLYLQHDNGFFGNFAAAFPLTKSIDAPTYGGNGKNPRYIVQISYKF